VEHTDSINALSDVDTNTTAPTDGQILKWNNTNSKWYPGDVEENASGAQKAIFGFGYHISSTTNVTNLVSSTGVVASDTTGVGTSRYRLAGSGYGGDKAIFGFGSFSGSPYTSVTNLVSNSGVVATDTAGVGTARRGTAGANYGEGKAIFGFGEQSSNNGSTTNISNLVSSSGVVASDTTGVGTARDYLAAAGYDGDKAIFGFGSVGNNARRYNLVSNAGVVSSDVTGVGTSYYGLGGASYGGDKAIFGFGIKGEETNTTNLVSNTGVVGSDVTTVGTEKELTAAAGYGGDKAIFGYGRSYTLPGYVLHRFNHTNLVSNTGVVSSDVTGVGSVRHSLAAAGFSSTA